MGNRNSMQAVVKFRLYHQYELSKLIKRDQHRLHSGAGNDKFSGLSNPG